MKRITKDQLLKFGFIETGNPIVPIEKQLSEGNGISIVVTRERNSDELAISLPDGMLYLGGIKSLNDIKTIEKFITGYSTNY